MGTLGLELTNGRVGVSCVKMGWRIVLGILSPHFQEPCQENQALMWDHR
jgi:hypothetical protein